VSRNTPRHQKPSRRASTRRKSAGRPSAPARHQRQSLAAAKPPAARVRIAAAVAGSALLISGALAVVTHQHGPRAHSATLYRTSAMNTTRSAGGVDGTAAPSRSAPARIAAHHTAAHHTAAHHTAAEHTAAEHAAAQHAAARHEKQRQARLDPTLASVYRDPLRAVSHLVAERVDQGVDFGGAGPVYALGDGVITSAMTGKAGWPGGGWITYRLTDGPNTGFTVFVAEDVTPAVQVGQTVTSSTVIANMFDGGNGIETGWANSDGSAAESQTPEAGASNGNGPSPTIVGLNFEAVLEGLGVPAAPSAS
jgi:hypothetical protein